MFKGSPITGQVYTMKTLVRILALILLLLTGCEEWGETDIHGRPVKPLPAGQVRIAVTEKTLGRIDLKVFLSGNMAGWSHVGILPQYVFRSERL